MAFFGLGQTDTFSVSVLQWPVVIRHQLVEPIPPPQHYDTTAGILAAALAQANSRRRYNLVRVRVAELTVCYLIAELGRRVLRQE